MGKLTDVDHQQFAPKKESVNTVIDWLLEAGLDVSHDKHYNHWKGAILIDMPISVAEKLCESRAFDIEVHFTDEIRTKSTQRTILTSINHREPITSLVQNTQCLRQSSHTLISSCLLSISTCHLHVNLPAWFVSKATS